ncbi:type IV pilus assembly protein PilM [Candidatus Auribacterota bacterium]
MLFQNRKMIGVDIGDSSIKFVELERVKDSIRLINYDVIEFDSGKSDPFETDAFKQSAFAEKIKSYYDSGRLTDSSCVVGISGQAVFIRFVKLPAVEKKKMDQIIKYEAQQQVPFPIEEVRWDYQLLHRSSAEECDILLVAVKQDIVRTLVNSITRYGLMPEIVDVLPLSLYNCLAYNDFIRDDTSLIVDIGAKTTNLIVAGGDDLWIRSIPYAGNSITQRIAADAGISFEDADKLKKTSGLDISAGGGADAKVNTTIEKGVSRLFAEVSRSLGFFKSQFGGSPIKQIYITGGGSRLRNVDRALSERFKLPVLKIEPLRKIDVVLEDTSRTGSLRENEHLFCNAVGLALRELVKTPLKVNLIPADLLRQRRFVRKFPYYAASFLIVIIMLFSIKLSSTKMAQANATRSKDLLVFSKYIEVLNTHFKKINDGVAVINNKLNIVHRLIDERDLWMSIALEVQKVMPSNVWIDNVSSNPEELMAGKTGRGKTSRKGRKKQRAAIRDFKEVKVIYLEGKGTGSIEEEIPPFRDSLEASPLFNEVEIISANLEDGQISFVLKLKLDE